MVIIHQNNSISTNVEYLNTFEKQQQQQLSNSNSMESSSFSSTTSSTTSSSNNVDLFTPYIESSAAQEDLKYMKGYVNVLKERFTRRSLGNQISVEADGISPLSSSASSTPTAGSQTNGQAIRMSISDYQRRKQQISSSNCRVVASNNDYQRRRSASPFTSRSASTNHFIEFNSNVNTTGAVVASTGSKEMVVATATAESKSLYTKNHVKKQFASSDDLRSFSANCKCFAIVLGKVLINKNKLFCFGKVGGGQTGDREAAGSYSIA